MDLLTFLGTGTYKEVTYVWGDHRLRTCFAAEAIATRLQPERVLVALTEGAEAHPNWPGLRDALQARGFIVQPVRIPDGASEEDLWGIFRALAAAITPESEVAIDVTHGLRSLPMLAVVLAGYLKTTAGIEVSHVVYGAFEASKSDEKPVFDLTPFLRLMDWMQAAKFFRVSGDSRELAELMKGSLAHASVHEKEVKELGTSLAELSADLATTRAMSVPSAASKALRKLDALEEPKRPASEPVFHLLAQLRETYAPLAAEGLEGGLRLVEWYAARGRAMQALSLAREWLVSLAGEALGVHDITAREDVEHYLSCLPGARRPGDADRTDETDALADESSRQPEPAENLPELPSPLRERLGPVWGDIKDLRNDVMHCGYRKDPFQADTILRKVKELPGRLRPLLDLMAQRQETST